jgi:hypothetical protein
MTSVAASLARQVERYADRLRTSHPLLKLAEGGGLPPSGVAAYVASTRFAVAYTQRHLRAAELRCIELRDLSLAAFFRKKCKEEAGHEAWAESDLSQLSRLFGTAEEPAVSPHMIRSG